MLQPMQLGEIQSRSWRLCLLLHLLPTVSLSAIVSNTCDASRHSPSLVAETRADAASIKLETTPPPQTQSSQISPALPGTSHIYRVTDGVWRLDCRRLGFGGEKASYTEGIQRGEDLLRIQDRILAEILRAS